MNAVEILRDEVAGTVFANPDRFAALVRDIRTFLLGCHAGACAHEASAKAAVDPMFLRGPDQRRAIVRRFLSEFGPMRADAVLDEMAAPGLRKNNGGHHAS